MSKRNLTLADHLELAGARAPGIAMRASAGLLVIILVSGVAYAAVQSGQNAPKPPWSLHSWTHWWSADPNAALVAILSGLGNAGGFGLAIFQVWYSTAAREAETRHAARLEAMEAQLQQSGMGSKGCAQSGQIEVPDLELLVVVVADLTERGD